MNKPIPSPIDAGFARQAGQSARGMLPPSRERRPLSPGQVARRRFFVLWTKRLLPLLAIGLLGVIAFWPDIEGGEHSRVSFRVQQQTRPEGLQVVGPRYQGIDDAGRPFTVTARVARQRGSTEVLDLEYPKADITLTDGAWVYIEAKGGLYDRPNNMLTLTGDVTIFHDNGVSFVTQEAILQIDQASGSGDTPVAAQGDFGTLTAAGFRLRDRGNVVIFTGHAHAMLEGRRQ